MSTVDLNGIEATLNRTLDGIQKCLLDVFDALRAEFLRRYMCVVPSNGRRSHDLIGPSIYILAGNSATAQPRGLKSIRQLNSQIQ